MPFGLRWPFGRKPANVPAEAGAAGSASAAARLPSEPHSLEIDPELGAALARRAAGAADLPRLGAQAGLRQVARALVGAEEFASALTAPAWSSEVARDLEPPSGASPGEFASHLGSLASLRDPWSTGPLESGSPFAETFAPAEHGAVFATPWGPRTTAGGARGGIPAAQPARVAARIASTGPASPEPGLLVSGGTWSAPVAPAIVPPSGVRLAQPLREPGEAGPQPSAGTPPPVAARPGPAAPPAEAREAGPSPQQAAVEQPGPPVSLPPATAETALPGASEAAPPPAEPPVFADLPLAPAAPPAPGVPPIQREAAAGAPAAAAAPPPGAAAETSVAGSAPSLTAPPSDPSPRETPPPGPPARILAPSEMLITPGLLPGTPPGDEAAPARPEAPMTLFAPPEAMPAAPVLAQRAQGPDAPAVPAAPPSARPAEPASAPIAPVSAEPSPARVAEPPITVQRDAVPPLPPTAEGEATPSEQRPPTPPPAPVPMPLVEPPPEIALVTLSDATRPAEAPPQDPLQAATPGPSPARPAAGAVLAGAPAGAQRSELELHSPASFAEGIVRRHAESMARGPAAVVASARRLVARYVTAAEGAPGAPPSTPTTTPLASAAAPSTSPAGAGTGPLFAPAWDPTPYPADDVSDLVLPATSAPSPWVAAGQAGLVAPPVQRQAASTPPAISAAARGERFAPVSDLPLAPVAAAAAGAGPVQLFREAPQGNQASGTVTSTGTPAPAGEQAAPAENIDRLADRVWQIVRRRLQIERERQRGLP